MIRQEQVKKYIAECRIFGIKDGRSSGDVKVKPLVSEKNRTFVAEVCDFSVFVKINIPFWDDENGSQKMVNEKTALNILRKNKIDNVPRLYQYDKNGNIFNAEVLLTEYIPDTKKSLNINNVGKLAEFVRQVHSIKSKTFTVPYSNFVKKIKGDGYDFINSYVRILRQDIDQIQQYSALEKMALDASLEDFFQIIAHKIIDNKGAFKVTTEFSLIHGHLTRNRERKHILIDCDGRLYVIDWENVCFGERELELASFLYENTMLSQKIKAKFITFYKGEEKIDNWKIYVYMYLLCLDDLVEQFKRIIIMFKAGRRPVIDKRFIVELLRQKKLLLNLQKRI